MMQHVCWLCRSLALQRLIIQVKHAHLVFRTDTVDVDGTTSATTAEAPDTVTHDGSISSAQAPPPPVPPSTNDATSELLDCGSFR